MITQKLLIIHICIFIVITAHAEKKSGIRFRGSMYSDLGIIQTVHSHTKDDVHFAGMSILSLNFKNTNRKYGKVEGLFDIMIPYGKMIERYIPAQSDTTNNWESLLEFYQLFSFEKAPILLNLRKFYLSIFLPFADVTIGRQIINLGKGLLFSPIDVFSTIEILDINFRRNGADIVAVGIPFSNLTGIDFITELPFLQNDYSLATKFYTTLFDFDFSIVGIFKKKKAVNNKKDEIVLGICFKGDAEIGIYSEMVTHYLYKSKKNYFEGMIGADYSIKGKWYFIVEYLYKQYNWEQSVWGEHNLFSSLRYSINDITNVSTNIIYDFQQNSVVGIVQWYYNILQNVNTIAYIQGSDNSFSTNLMYALRVEVKF